MFPSTVLGELGRLMAGFITARNAHRVERFEEAVAATTEKIKQFCVDAQTFDTESEARKQQLLATKSALLAENKQLKAAHSRLISSPPTLGAVAMIHALTYMQNHFEHLKRKSMSLSRIASKIDSDTFYWDLLFWLVVPRARVEEMLGDLSEEYLIRASNNEVATARA